MLTHSTAIIQHVRVAWFSPLPPTRSGIAAYSAEILPLLAADHTIDAFVDSPGERAAAPAAYAAHDFVWRHRLAPYDLIVYQLGNARCHDYMWAYVVRYPGLVVLHDARLHHARARMLLQNGRAADYRAEFAFDHPGAPLDFAEYAVEGLGGPIYYFWPMLRTVVTTARLVGVHNPRVAADLKDDFPGVAIEAIDMGVGPGKTPPDARYAARRALQIPETAVVFAAFGKITPEKRIGAILRAVAALKGQGVNAWAMLVGDAGDYPLSADIAALDVGDRVRVTGYVDDDAIASSLAAADACLCLRWPTALETSASWLRCLAAAKATVISDLAHLVDVPSEVARRVDLLDEDRVLAVTMHELASDPRARAALAAAGHAWWARHHTLERMAQDYRRLFQAAHARQAPAPPDLPAHLRADHSALARSIARDLGVAIDLFQGTRA